MALKSIYCICGNRLDGKRVGGLESGQRVTVSPCLCEAPEPVEVKTVTNVREGYEGVWHGALRVDVEPVTRQHKKVCEHCGELPESMRLKLAEGVGRSRKTKIYCRECGVRWFDEHRRELERARWRLDTADRETCIRASASD